MAKNPARLTSAILTLVSGYLRSGVLATLTIQQVPGKRRWTVEYSINNHSFATSSNYRNRQEKADLFKTLSEALESKGIKTMYFSLTSPITYHFHYAVTLEEASPQEIAEEAAEVSLEEVVEPASEEASRAYGEEDVTLDA